MLQKQSRWFTYFLFQHNGTILTRKRTGKDIWQNLDEFYLLETNEKPNWSKNAIHEWLTTQFNISDGVILHISPLIVQQLTHQLIKGYFIRVEISSIPFQPGHPILNNRIICQPCLIARYVRTR